MSSCFFLGSSSTGSKTPWPLRLRNKTSVSRLSIAQAGAFEHRQTADSAGGVDARRSDTGGGDDRIDVVAHEIRRLDVVVQVAELQVGGRGDHRAELALDTDHFVDVVGHRGAEAVVAETRRAVLRRKERRARGNHGDFDYARTRSRGG